MFVLCGTATCTQTKPRTEVERAATASKATLPLDVSAAVESTDTTSQVAPATNPPPAGLELQRAVLEHDYVRASKLLDTATWELEPPTITLLRGFLALHDARPLHTLEHLDRLGSAFGPLKVWLEELRADALASAPAYIDHLDEIVRRAPFRRLVAVTERLLEDKRLTSAERTLVLAQARSVGDVQNGELRWLRARLRLASGRAASAHADVRWLVVTHPEHPRADAALAAIARGAFPALTTFELLARAGAAAESGLVDVVDQSIAAAVASAPAQLPPGERPYLRGVALYRARRFAEAIAPLDEAVRLLAPRRDRARYLAALAASRSGAGEEALNRFAAISLLKPITENVQNASFLLGREHSLLGNWTSASEHYTRFVTQFPNHEFAQAAHRDRLVAWFGEGNYKRFVYWVRQFRQRYPDAKETLLLRSLEALALHRLGHTEQARPMWEDLARVAPLAFVGIAARQRLAELGVDVASPFERTQTPGPVPKVSLPAIVDELERAGLSEQSEWVFGTLETSISRAHAPNDAAALCEASSQLERGRRRFELGRGFAAQRSIKDAPQFAPDWLWRCLFPSPHQVSVTAHAATHHVSTALIYAVMRQESAFRVDAISSAGARGLMQIIDPTARRIAVELGRSYDPEHLDVAHHNIEYGAFYLSKLQAYLRHPALVAAAYNAGPEATTRWFAAGRSLPLEAFVVRIPYDETRSYVQRVLENLVAYQTLLGSDPPSGIALDFAPQLGQGAPVEAMHRAPDGFY